MFLSNAISVLEMLLPTTALAAHLEAGSGTSVVALTSDLLSASNSQSQYLPLPPSDNVQVSAVQVRELVVGLGLCIGETNKCRVEC